MYLFKQKRKRLLNVAAGIVVAILSISAYAQPVLGDSATHKESEWPQAALNAEASAVVPQDTVKITLAAETNGPSQTKVASELSKTLESVMRDAKGDVKIKVRSGNYRLWPFNDKEGKITSWQGHGEIILESTDFTAASALAAKLSDRMPISNLAFSVSAQARAKQEQALLAEAAQAFRDKAKALTEAFGFSAYAIRNVDVSGGGAQYQPVPRMMAAAADKSSIPLEGGTEVVTVSVRGSIFLHSKQK